MGKLATNTLDDLANKINVCAAKADDYRVTAACHLAKAKNLCGEQGITFKDWVRDNIKFSYDEARKLAVAGEFGDPAGAIADMRAGDRARKQAQRAVGRPTADPVADDEPDEAAGRYRGLAACCDQGRDCAEDALHNVKWLVKHASLDNATLKAVEAASDAWFRVLSLVAEKRAAMVGRAFRAEKQASTLPQDGRSEVAVDAEIEVDDLGDVPAFLDRRGAHGG